MLRENKTSYISLVLCAIAMVLGFLILFTSGCATKQPSTMTIDERLEPYRYLIRDTLLRGDEADVFVGDGYYNFNSQQRMDFAQNLSWSYYPRKIVVRDVNNNYILMTVSEDRRIQLIWQQDPIEGKK
jgi:hypothetical protein